jgi:hypothetical protein
MQTPYDAYVAGLTKIGTLEAHKLRLSEAVPAPPDRGANAWKVQLLQMTDAPLPGATINKVTPFMPAHNHGTGVIPTIGTTDADAYVEVQNIDFMMPGVWTVTFDITHGNQADTTTFAFCIDG